MRKTIVKNAVLYLGIAFYSLSTLATLPALAGLKNDDRGEFPDGRVGGGTRGTGLCRESDRQLVVLNPLDNIGVTASDRPLIYVAVPQLNQLYPAEFVLSDAKGNAIYETTFEIGESRDFLMGIRLPENILDIGQDYNWDFFVSCDSDTYAVEISSVGGTLRQVSSEVARESNSTLEEHLNQVQSYQEAGLWSDAIATAVALRQTYPNSDRVRNRWQELLSALDFSQHRGVLEMLLEIQVPALQLSDESRETSLPN